MAIAITSGPVTAHGSASGTLALTLTGVGVGDLIVVGLDLYEVGGVGDNTISSVTISGESNATFVGTANECSTGNLTRTILQFATLTSVTASGSKTVTANFTGSVNWPQANMVAFALSGASGVDTFGYEQQTTNSSSNPGVTITLTADDFIFSLIAYTASDPGPNSGYTGISLTDNNFFDAGEYRLTAGGTGSLRVAYPSGGSGQWVVGAVAISPSAGTASVKRLLTLGAG